jgi:WD40 repeat protein
MNRRWLHLVLVTSFLCLRDRLAAAEEPKPFLRDKTLSSACFVGDHTLVTGHKSGHLCQWDVRTGKRLWRKQVIQTPARIEDLQLADKGRRVLFVTVAGRTEIHACELKTRQSRRLVHSGTVVEYCVTRDYRYLVSIHVNCTVRVFDIAKGKQVVRASPAFRSRNPLPASLSLSSDDKLVVVSFTCLNSKWDPRDPRAILFKLPTLDREADIPYSNWSSFNSIALHPKKPRRLALSGEGTLEVVDIGGKKVLETHKVPGDVQKLCHVPDGKAMVASCSGENESVVVVRGAKVTVLAKFRSPSRNVEWLSVSPNSKLLAVLVQDEGAGEVDLFDLGTLRPYRYQPSDTEPPPSGR